MWTLAAIFACVYALPELTLFFAYSTLEALGYSAFLGAAMTIVVKRLNGPARASALIVGGVIFGFPLPMMLSAGYPMDVSGIWLFRAFWFSISTALLLIATGSSNDNEHWIATSSARTRARYCLSSTRRTRKTFS